MGKRVGELASCECCARSLPSSTQATACVDRRTGEHRRLALCVACLSKDHATWRLKWAEVKR
jgi:hypothetical protein